MNVCKEHNSGLDNFGICKDCEDLIDDYIFKFRNQNYQEKHSIRSLKKFVYWESEFSSSLFEITDDDFQTDKMLKITFNDDEKPIFKFFIFASTFEEACAIKHLRLGYEPYKPMGPPLQCDACGFYYYKGTGLCSCGKIFE